MYLLHELHVCSICKELEYVTDGRPAVSSSIGVLLPELVVSIILLITIDAGLMQETGSIPLLAGLLEHLDRFNHLAPGHERDDNEDLAWPGIMGITPVVLLK